MTENFDPEIRKNELFGRAAILIAQSEVQLKTLSNKATAGLHIIKIIEEFSSIVEELLELGATKMELEMIVSKYHYYLSLDHMEEEKKKEEQFMLNEVYASCIEE